MKNLFTQRICFYNGSKIKIIKKQLRSNRVLAPIRKTKHSIKAYFASNTRATMLSNPTDGYIRTWDRTTLILAP